MEFRNGNVDASVYEVFNYLSKGITYLQEQSVDVVDAAGRFYKELKTPAEYGTQIVETCGPRVVAAATNTFTVIAAAWVQFDHAAGVEGTKMHLLGAMGIWCALTAIVAKVSGHKALTGVMAGFTFTTVYTVWHGLSEGTVVAALAKPISTIAITVISALTTWVITPAKEHVSLPRAFVLVWSPLLVASALFAAAELAKSPLNV